MRRLPRSRKMERIWSQRFFLRNTCSKIWSTATCRSFQSKKCAGLQAAQQNVKKAFDAGVKVAFGTDAAVYPHGLNAGEFHVYVKLGMTPLAAIQTATINASDLLGPKYLVGSLEPGKWADVVAVDGDPTKDDYVRPFAGLKRTDKIFRPEQVGSV